MVPKDARDVHKLLKDRSRSPYYDICSSLNIGLFLKLINHLYSNRGVLINNTGTPAFTDDELYIIYTSIPYRFTVYVNKNDNVVLMAPNSATINILIASVITEFVNYAISYDPTSFRRIVWYDAKIFYKYFYKRNNLKHVRFMEEA